MNRVYAELSKYLDALCLLFITDENVRRQCDRCGIRFSTLPKTEATKIAAKAQSIKNFELARHELKDDIMFLEYGEPDFAQVPLDDIAFTEKLNTFLQRQKVYQLCLEGINDPTTAEEKIKNFQETLSANVSYGEYDGLMSVFLPEWKEKVDQDEQEIIIPNFERLSKMIGGFNPGRIAILLADTGFGKTNLGLLLALAARHIMGVIYFNMEMGFNDICKRMAVLESGIAHRDFFNKVKSTEWIKSFSNNGKGLCITDGRTLSPNQIKALIRSKAKDHGIGFVVIDYDQCLELQTNRDTPEWKALQKTLSDLDNFAKEMNCFILVLSQLNREGEISASHRALYKAHTVLHFREDETHGVVIHAKKNRHGKKNAALVVNYDEDSSAVTECESLVLGSKKQKREIKIPNYSPPKRVPYAD